MRGLAGVSSTAALLLTACYSGLPYDERLADDTEGTELVGESEVSTVGAGGSEGSPSGDWTGERTTGGGPGPVDPIDEGSEGREPPTSVGSTSGAPPSETTTAWEGSEDDGPWVESTTGTSPTSNGTTSTSTTTTTTTSGETNVTTVDPTNDTAGPTTDDPPDPLPSPGCGTTPGSVMSGEITVDGETRTYVIELPEDYDADVAYPLTLGLHGSGGSGASSQRSYRLSEHWEGGSIVVYPDALRHPDAGTTRWEFSPTGYDFVFFDALIDRVLSQLCVDQERIFTYGYSAGGYMSNYLGCYRSEVFRGIGSISGGAPSRNCGTGKAVYLVHGETDTTVLFSVGLASLALWTEINGCSEDTEPTGVEGCERLLGCQAENPVTWCTHPGGHSFDTTTAARVVEMFRSL